MTFIKKKNVKKKGRLKMKIAIEPKTKNNFIWCYKKDCKYFLAASEDSDGKFGFCRKEEIIIDRNGKCKSMKIEEDKSSEMLRETGIYIDEISKVGGFGKDYPIGDEDDGYQD
jgi:hypothetical protein